MTINRLVHMANQVAAFFASYPEAEAIEVATEARPDVFLGVPRVWEKARAGIEAALHAERNPVRRILAQRAIDVGLRAIRLEQAGKPVPPWIAIPRMLFDRVVFSTIRGRLGLDRTKVVLTGSAPTPPDVLAFFHAIGLRILDTWGMTELTGAATLNPPDAWKIGSVGVRAVKTTMPERSSDFAFVADGRDKWGIGFMITADERPGNRSAGSLSWGGINNTYFWIDPRRGIAGVILMQYLPFADSKALAVWDGFERAVYRLLRSKN